MDIARIPSALSKIDFSAKLCIKPEIPSTEGTVIIAEVISPTHAVMIEDCDGILHPVVEGSKIPGVLGKRRAVREQSGDIPEKIMVGGILHLLCESGVMGICTGFNSHDERPPELRVVGAIAIDGKVVNTKDTTIPRVQQLIDIAPIIGVVGTCMDVGKTTMVCKMIQEFRKKEFKVAAAKLSGVAFMRDILSMRKAGACPVTSFMDCGLPSTCTDTAEVICVAMSAIHKANIGGPDLIIVEFGDSILGEYGVEQLIRCSGIQQNIVAFIVCANDLVSAYGAHHLMRKYGVQVSLTSGPAANNATSAQYIEEQIGGLAESNQHEIGKTMAFLENKLRGFCRNEIENCTPAGKI